MWCCLGPINTCKLTWLYELIHLMREQWDEMLLWSLFSLLKNTNINFYLTLFCLFSVSGSVHFKWLSFFWSGRLYLCLKLLLSGPLCIKSLYIESVHSLSSTSKTVIYSCLKSLVPCCSCDFVSLCPDYSFLKYNFTLKLASFFEILKYCYQ